MLPSSNMSGVPQFTSAAYGVAAVFAWGTSDFLGGYATRRANAFLLTVFVNIGGLLLVGTLASASHAVFQQAQPGCWPAELQEARRWAFFIAPSLREEWDSPLRWQPW
jgi:hypothetical protein